MIFKTALATLITASMAGGVVYYGVQTDEIDGIDSILVDHPHGESEQSDLQENTNDELIVENDEPTERVIDKLLRRSSTSDTDVEAPDVEIDEESQDATEFVEQQFDEVEIPQDEVEQDSPEFDETNTVEYSENHGDMVDIVFEQIDMIEAEGLKDQAYLEVIEYAVQNRKIDLADMTLAKIQQVEIRDTARSKIAIGLAQAGSPEKAFAVIDAIETEKWRDVMRLQVIEALIATGQHAPD